MSLRIRTEPSTRASLPCSAALRKSLLLLRSGLLHLLVLTPYCEAAHVHRDGNDYFGVPGRLPGFVVDVSGFDPFPLGAPVLEPDLHLHLAQLERMRDLRALGERQVLLAVELLLQLQQLLAGERRPPPPVLPAAAASRPGPAAAGTVHVRAVVQTSSAAVRVLLVAHGREVVVRAVVQVGVHGEALVLPAAVVLLGLVFTVSSDCEEEERSHHQNQNQNQNTLSNNTNTKFTSLNDSTFYSYLQKNIQIYILKRASTFKHVILI